MSPPILKAVPSPDPVATETGIGAQTPVEAPAMPGTDPLVACMLYVLGRLERPMSVAAFRSRVPRPPAGWTFEDCVEAVESLGCSTNLQTLDSRAVDPLLGPWIVETREGPIVVHASLQDDRVRVYDPRVGADTRLLSVEAFESELASVFSGRAMAISLRPAALGAARAPQGRHGHWFWGPILRNRWIYGQVAIAALVTNVFALATSFFSMIVYDRVIPNNAVETLLALLIGISIVFVSDFAIRTLRGYFLDVAGSRADAAIADSLFEHVMDIELRAKRGSTGAIANILKEFEQVRDFCTSTTLTTLVDLPFAVLFLAVIGLVAGPLVWVPLVCIPIVIIASLIVQPTISRLTRAGHDDRQYKNTVLVEALQGMETIKSLGAASLMRRRWQEAVTSEARIGLRMRLAAQFASNMSNFVYQAMQVAIVTYGFYLVTAGQIGFGAIIATSILAGRAIQPLAQLTMLLSRFNQTLVSYRGLRDLMQQPRERPTDMTYVARERLRGAVEFRNVEFRYPGQSAGGLEGLSFKIQPGEKVAILGRVGSGKTTLSKLILGLFRPNEGAVLIDGVDARQIDPADLRRNIGVVLQDVWLMSGTVRQNIVLGAEEATDADVLRVAAIAGVTDFIDRHPDGFGLRVGERGEGLSGGQRQAITIARALLPRPPILLLDEPSSAMDAQSEQQLLKRLKSEFADRTVIVITHRASLLELVDRVIVIEQGRIAADGPKAAVLRAQPGGAGG
jgi:ATP-binding cassette subfamily C protein LapB